jgi:hypothetical protein
MLANKDKKKKLIMQYERSIRSTEVALRMAKENLERAKSPLAIATASEEVRAHENSLRYFQDMIKALRR